jgi:hypothetical protein
MIFINFREMFFDKQTCGVLFGRKREILGYFHVNQVHF